MGTTNVRPLLSGKSVNLESLDATKVIRVVSSIIFHIKWNFFLFFLFFEYIFKYSQEKKTFIFRN